MSFLTYSQYLGGLTSRSTGREAAVTLLAMDVDLQASRDPAAAPVSSTVRPRVEFYFAP